MSSPSLPSGARRQEKYQQIFTVQAAAKLIQESAGAR
jgi:hypothetical protein